MNTTSLAEQVGACRRAQFQWARNSIRDRLPVVRRFRQSLVAARDRLGAAVQSEIGRAPAETLAAEILPLADACRFLELEAARILKPRRAPLRRRPLWLWGQRDTIHRRPHGVVGIVGTWNYPLFLNGVQIAQALVAGNAVAWKPSEISTASAPLLHQLFLDAGAPTELLQMLPARREAGAELVEADIDHLVFTGSAAVGRTIAARLGERLVSSTLELSGCDAMFVLADADVELAARAAWFGATLNRGQTCIAVRRAFVHRSIYPAFIEQIAAKLAAAKPVTLVTPGQVQQADRLVADAQAKGGRVVNSFCRDAESSERNALDSLTLASRLTAPRVIVDATPEMAACREDCFAPLLAIVPFDSPGEALCMNAACRYGLSSSIFTADVRTGEDFASKLPAGSTCINDVIAPTAHPATPFGGRRQSGWGVTQGPDGLLAMTVPQVVSVRGGTFRPHYEPMNEPTQRLLTGLLAWRHAPRFADRWRGFWTMVSRGRRMEET